MASVRKVDLPRLDGRTALVTGASRGIGAATAERFAAAGANVAVLGTSTEPREGRLPGTVPEVAERIGERALGVIADVRDDTAVEAAVEAVVDRFGGLDIIVNNAAAFDIRPSAKSSMNRYDLLQSVNARGAFLLVSTALPHLEASPHAHVLSISPPLTLDPAWFGAHLPYTLAKYGMSMQTLGFAAEFADRPIAANALWPRTAIATEGIRVLLGDEVAERQARSPRIMADAALAIVGRPPDECTGNLFLDDDVVRDAGLDPASYDLVPGAELQPSFFLP